MSDSSFRFTTEIPVRWVDIDSVGVLNNAVYLSFLEQARFEYFRQLDLLEDGQFPFVLGETTVRYHRPGRAGMRLTVAVRTTKLGTKSFDMGYEVLHQEDLLCTARATLVYVDEQLVSREIPSRVRDVIGEFEGLHRGCS